MSRIQCINYVCLHCPVKPVFSAQTQMPCGESQALCDSSPWRPQALLDREVNKYWDLGTNQSMPSSHVLHSYIRRLKCMSHKTNLTQLKYELYSAHEKCDVWSGPKTHHVSPKSGFVQRLVPFKASKKSKFSEGLWPYYYPYSMLGLRLHVALRSPCPEYAVESSGWTVCTCSRAGRATMMQKCLANL